LEHIIYCVDVALDQELQWPDAETRQLLEGGVL
jgi:hypothetical protein